MFKGFVNPVVKQHVERRIVKTTPGHFFRIIADVDNYAKFLPFCSHAKILKQWDSGRRFEAATTIEFPPIIRETYLSSVTLIPEQFLVEVRSIKSTAFDDLQSRWQLRSIDEFNTDVSLEVKITSSDPILSVGLEYLVPQIAQKQVAAFESRCRQLPLTYYDEKQSIPTQ